MTDARLNHFYSGLLQSGLDLFFQRFSNVHRIAAQRLFTLSGSFIRIRRCEVAQRRLTLDRDKLFVVIHLEHRFRTVDHPPNNYGGNLDGTAGGVVHLQLATLKVTYSKRHGAFCIKRVCPAQTRFFCRADITPEQLQNLGFVRLYLKQPNAGEDRQSDANTTKNGRKTQKIVDAKGPQQNGNQCGQVARHRGNSDFTMGHARLQSKQTRSKASHNSQQNDIFLISIYRHLTSVGHRHKLRPEPGHNAHLPMTGDDLG